MAKKSSIWVGKEAYQYLLNLSITQRCGYNPNTETLDKKWKTKLSTAGANGMVQLTDNDLRGADSVGVWCSWTLQDMKYFLKRKGLKWQRGKMVEYVSI